MQHAGDLNSDHRNDESSRLRLVPSAAHALPLRHEIPRQLRSQWPTLSVLSLVFASVAVIGFGFRWSVGVLALALGLAFTLRLTLPRRRVGWLEVRRKRTDLVCLGLLLLGVVLVALATPS